MRILITGNLGYIGPCVTRQLRITWPNTRIIGLDTGYFSESALDNSETPECQVDQQISMDIRDLPAGLFNNVDAVVHLAALSNDSTGKTFESSAQDINYRATVETARRAKKAGVKSFVFASSCRVYGPTAGIGAPVSETSELNPRTAYTRSKVAAELGLRSLAGRDFTITSLRFATACGMSPRLRLDTVLNDCLATAVTKGEIRVSGNGDQERPLIHVRDMARVIDWAIARPSANGGSFLALNTGSDSWTWRTREIADAVAEVIPRVFVSANPDTAVTAPSAKVDFSLFRRLAPLHQPRERLVPALLEMKVALESYLAVNQADASGLTRLRALTELVKQGRLYSDLTWAPRPMPAAREARYSLARTA